MLLETGTISTKIQILQPLALFGPRIGGRTEKACAVRVILYPFTQWGSCCRLEAQVGDLR